MPAAFLLLSVRFTPISSRANHRHFNFQSFPRRTLSPSRTLFSPYSTLPLTRSSKCAETDIPQPRCISTLSPIRLQSNAPVREMTIIKPVSIPIRSSAVPPNGGRLPLPSSATISLLAPQIPAEYNTDYNTLPSYIPQLCSFSAAVTASQFLAQMT